MLPDFRKRRPAPSGGIDAMDVVKLRIQGSRDFGKFDAVIWAAWAGGFNRTASYVTSVAGVGTLSPSALKNIAWGEYGVRIGYKLSENLTADVFANGISGIPISARGFMAAQG